MTIEIDEIDKVIRTRGYIAYRELTEYVDGFYSDGELSGWFLEITELEISREQYHELFGNRIETASRIVDIQGKVGYLELKEFMSEIEDRNRYFIRGTNLKIKE